MQLRPIAAMRGRMIGFVSRVGGRSVISPQKAEFQERIARIAAGQGSTRATVFVGQDFTFSYQPQNRRRKPGLAEVLRNAGYSLSFPFCLAIGFLSHALQCYARWITLGVPQEPANIDVDMAVVAAASSSIAILLTHLLGLRDRGLLVPKVLGVGGGMLFFHNLVHAYPDFFDQVFSPIWVAKITSMTEASSLYFRGVSFPF